MSSKNLWFAAFVVLQTGAIYGYSMGFIGGILVLPAFLRHFHLDHFPQRDRASAQSAIVSSWIVGAFFGVPAAIPVCSRLGRKPCLFLSAYLYMTETVLQLINAGSFVHVFEVGRLLNGLGVGAGTLVAPI